MEPFAPDAVFHNGRIVTVSRDFRIAEAFAVYAGRIVAVGDSDEVLQIAGPRTRLVDLGGRFVLPGQIDSYAHFVYSGVDLLGDRGKVNISAMRSVADIVQAIRARARTTPPGQWIMTSVMYRGALDEGRWPTLHDLDQAAPDHPVHLMQGGRPIIANSRALALAGIHRDSPDPVSPAGRIGRHDDGELSGQLIAGAADVARAAWASRIGEPPEHWDNSLYDVATMVDAVLAQQRVFHACGVTTVRDPEVSRRDAEALIVAHRRGLLTTRTAMAFRLSNWGLLGAASTDPFDSFFAPWPLGDDLLWNWGVSLGYVLEGWELLDRDTLARCLAEAARRNWTVGIVPSIGEVHALKDVLEILEGVDDPSVIAERGWALLHPEGLRESADIERAARLGLSVNPNPLLNYHAAARALLMHEQMSASGLHPGASSSPLEATKATWGMATRDWLHAGLTVTAGSNTPASVYDPDHPFLGQYCALTNDTLAGPLFADQSIGREDMIRIYSVNGATALGRGDRLGSIEVGKYADLVVVDRDLLTCSDREVADARVVETYSGGELVYQRS